MFSLLCFFWLFADSAQATSLLREGLLALQHNQIEQARTDLEQASQLAPGNPFVWSALAEIYWRLHETSLASSAAGKAEANSEANPAVAHALALYYSEAGDYAHAAALERRFAESSKADSDSLSRAAELYLKAGELAPALDLARKAVQRNPSALNKDLLGQIAFNDAQFLLKQGDNNAASALAEEMLAADAHDSQMLLVLGVARYGQRRFDEAIGVFLRVIQIDQEVEQPYLFLGRMLDQAGAHLPEITQHFESRVAQDPTNAKARVVLAKALLAANSHDGKAESLFRQAIQIDSKDWEAHYELGVLLSNEHKYAEAQRELARSIELAPKQPEPHYHLARVYDRLGETVLATAERELHQKLTSGGSGMQR